MAIQLDERNVPYYRATILIVQNNATTLHDKETLIQDSRQTVLNEDTSHKKYVGYLHDFSIQSCSEHGKLFKNRYIIFRKYRKFI